MALKSSSIFDTGLSTWRCDPLLKAWHIAVGKGGGGGGMRAWEGVSGFGWSSTTSASVQSSRLPSAPVKPPPEQAGTRGWFWRCGISATAGSCVGQVQPGSFLSGEFPHQMNSWKRQFAFLTASVSRCHSA